MLLAASGLDEFYKYFDQVRFPTSFTVQYLLLHPVPKTALFEAGHAMFDAMTHASDLKAVLFLVQPLEMEYVM